VWLRKAVPDVNARETKENLCGACLDIRAFLYDEQNEMRFVFRAFGTSNKHSEDRNLEDAWGARGLAW
jgi:hypothetical protein